MAKARRRRVGFGLVLFLLGLKNIVYPYPYPPVGTTEDVAYYGLNAAIALAGLWFVFRKPIPPPSDEGGSVEA